MWHSWQRTACLWLSAFAILFMLIAFFTPGWLIYNPTPDATIQTTTSIGLWYVVGCVKETGKTEDCSSSSYASAQNDLTTSTAGYNELNAFYDGMVEAEVEATLGLFACIVAVFCVFIAFTYWCESWYCCSIRYYMSSAAVAFLVAGVLVWIPTGRFARANDILDNYTGIKIGVPYSVILMAIGGILAFLVMFLLVWMLCTETQGRHSRKRRYSDSDYGDYNNHYSKYDERNTRPYSISDPPRYEKPRPSRYPEPRSLPPPPRVYEKRPPDYHHNYAYDSSLPRRHHAFHFDDYPRRNDNPSPYRGHSWYDRNMRY